jgi:acetyl-CoA/propionyl-CoA carboxylase, biotin carboxylase, biotin carboxyl carrier protein
MFRAVLVANRGEIALRVLRACKELGIATVGVYSEADREAPWLALADQAYLLGPAPASESYLDIGRILDVAERAGAEAIHPGYGFLSENADFADAVAGAGLVWVGPPSAAISAMGDKLSARQAAQAADCPVVPGTMEPTDDPDVVRAFADEHGYPVAIKAAFGGGGRGLKVVREQKELAAALDAAQREATAAFGRGEVYVERYLTRPRHIEAQVLADSHGACLFLGERDCSAQRRHQKLIEEAPAPNFPADVRAEFGDAAVRVSQQVGYEGAGTVEFLYEDDDFYFLEMNTRLQVEHPVTELVTGIDLVEEQLLVAAEEPLNLAQGDIDLRGHAIECRINAEAPERDFMPTPGTIGRYREPGGPGVRVDSAAESGADVPRANDPLLAKLVTYGADREEALRRALRALAEYEVEGVATTIPFHRLMLADPRFASGEYHTGTVEQELDLSALAPPDAPATTHVPAARYAERRFELELDGKRFDVSARELLDEPVRPSKPAPPAAGGKHLGGGTEVLSAPMQGTIVAVLVGEGDEVEAGQPVCVLEAMKMESEVRSQKAGTVSEVRVEAGQTVRSGDTLIFVE